MKKIVKFLIFFIIWSGLMIIHIAGLSAWGQFGVLWHLPLWFIVLGYFYLPRFWLWIVLIITGLALDIYYNFFGQELIALSLVGILLYWSLRRWLVHKNFISFFLAAVLAILGYTFGVWLWQNGIIIWLRPDDYWTMQWSVVWHFWLLNISALVMIYLIINLTNNFAHHVQKR
ncbi:MAG: hypothetical protein ACKKL5_03340 [Candidatus Komeilibacteria bacterium]